MDIQNLLQKISKCGLTDSQIGVEINAPQSIVTRLRNGTHKTTDFERGKKIFDLAIRLEIINAEGLERSAA